MHFCWLNSSTSKFSFVPQVLWCFLNHLTGESLMVLRQEIGVDTPHFLCSQSIFWDCHISHHKMWWTLILQTHVSWSTALQTYFKDCVKACWHYLNTSIISWNERSPECHMFTFYTVLSVSNVSCNCAIVTRVNGGPNSFLQHLCISFTFSIFQ